MIRRLALLVLLVFAVSPAFAVNPDEMLPDPALETRAREISAHLRCLVCQNQSIDDSNAQLAHDLRILVREKLKEGASDQQIYDYLVSRYGEFVLLNPRLSQHTVILWGAPALLLSVGAVSLLVLAARRRARRQGAPLSADEKAKLEAILRE